MIILRLVVTTFILISAYPVSGAVFGAAASSVQELSAKDRKHAASAFLFADRNSWNDAIAHAERAENGLLAEIIRWMQVRERNAYTSASSSLNFVERHPDWADRQLILRRSRDRILIEGADSHLIKKWLQLKPELPDGVTITAKRGEKSLIRDFVRYAWIEGNYSKEQEKEILRRLSRHLGKKEHIARTDRLIWEGQYSAAARMLPLLPKSYRRLSAARLALARNQRGVTAAISNVPAKLLNHPGLIYERLQWRWRKKLDNGVRKLLLSAPKNIPYPHKWWKIRASHIRDAIEEGNYKLAKKLLRNHGQTDGATLADALWLSGWLELEFMHNPKTAYKYFYKLFNAVRYPVSKARGAYYAGRAAAANGNDGIAKSWYEIAAAYPTVFYGQLAAYELHKSAPLRLPASYGPPAGSVDKFMKKKPARAVILLHEAGKKKLAVKFLNHVVDSAKSSEQSVIAARIGNYVGSRYLSVKGGKRLMRKSIIDLLSAYPVFSPNIGNSDIERALLLAVIRQESEFDHRAKSSAGAIGLMQLMPSTARLTARRLHIPYSKARLYEERYNTRLASAYLERLMAQFDGSYILAIAAYNAGSGNVRSWIKRFGHPPNGKENGDSGNLYDAILWTEQIPFAETRNYVQRVLENLQIYRHLSADGSGTPKLQLHKDLTL